MALRDHTEKQPGRQEESLTEKSGKPAPSLTTQDVCAGSVVPPGWIKINDRWDGTVCGNPVANSVSNVCTLAKYDELPIGSTLEICADATTPPGWILLTTVWDPTRCGHPIHPTTHNVKRIQRTA